jgi:hypothetical protein
MTLDEMGIGEILEVAEDLGWKGCFDLLGKEGEDPDELERRAIEYIWAQTPEPKTIENVNRTINQHTKKAVSND